MLKFNSEEIAKLIYNKYKLNNIPPSFELKHAKANQYKWKKINILIV